MYEYYEALGRLLRKLNSILNDLASHLQLIPRPADLCRDLELAMYKEAIYVSANEGAIKEKVAYFEALLKSLDSVSDPISLINNLFNSYSITFLYCQHELTQEEKNTEENEFSYEIQSSEDEDVQTKKESIAQLNLKKAYSVGYTEQEIDHFLRQGASPLLINKLSDKTFGLSIEQSIECIKSCINLCDASIEMVKGKKLVFFIGDTGSGKSTFVNYLHGCSMIEKSGCVMVSPDSEHAEIMSIGHSIYSKTFFPQTLLSENIDLVFCDGPGFRDNRGPEINIASSVTIRRVLTSADSIRLVLLISYESISPSRGKAIAELNEALINIFGTKDYNRFYESILIGVTKTPRELKRRIITIQDVREELFEFNHLPRELFDQTFIIDPLEVEQKDFALSRADWLERIKSSSPIIYNTHEFNTSLNENDRSFLIVISNFISTEIDHCFRLGKFKRASSYLTLLSSLSIINHSQIDKHIRDNILNLVGYIRIHEHGIVDLYDKAKFKNAEHKLREMKRIVDAFLAYLPNLGDQLAKIYENFNWKKLAKGLHELDNLLANLSEQYHQSPDDKLLLSIAICQSSHEKITDEANYIEFINSVLSKFHRLPKINRHAICLSDKILLLMKEYPEYPELLSNKMKYCASELNKILDDSSQEYQNYVLTRNARLKIDITENLHAIKGKISSQTNFNTFIQKLEMTHPTLSYQQLQTVLTQLGKASFLLPHTQLLGLSLSILHNYFIVQDDIDSFDKEIKVVGGYLMLLKDELKDAQAKREKEQATLQEQQIELQRKLDQEREIIKLQVLEIQEKERAVEEQQLNQQHYEHLAEKAIKDDMEEQQRLGAVFLAKKKEEARRRLIEIENRARELESNLAKSVANNLKQNLHVREAVNTWLSSDAAMEPHPTTEETTDFYQLMNAKLTNEFNLADKKLLLQLANRYLEQGEKLSNISSLVSWAKRIKSDLDEQGYQWIFNEIGFKVTITFEQFTSLCSKICDLFILDRQKIMELLEIDVKDIKMPEFNQQLEELRTEIMHKRYPEQPLETVLAGFAEDSVDVKVKLSSVELGIIKENYLKSAQYAKKERLSDLGLDDLKAKIGLVKKNSTFSKQQQQLQILAVAREIIRRKFGIFPYNTQILAVLGLLNWPDKFKGRLGQVRTGEGKSTIVALLATVLACQGHFVDIITSSSYLAERDQKKYQSYFELFGITTSHICVEQPTAIDFQGQIVYGSNYDFEFAFLRDALAEKHTRVLHRQANRLRPYDAVIVDEVDNMLVDRATESARIANCKDPTMPHLILPYVFQLVSENGEEANITPTELKNYLNRHVPQNNQMYIPEESTLQQWLLNAHKALYELHENTEYVVKVEEDIRDGKCVHERAIVIVDFKHTGQLQPGCRWQNGLHEFVELKHNIQIKPLVLTVAAVSHPSFFNMYKLILGLSGTLGDAILRGELKNTYQLDTFDVPPHKKNQRELLEPKFFKTREQYLQFIVEETLAARELKRAQLLLTKTIQESLSLAEKLAEHEVDVQIYNANQAEETDFLVSRAGNPCMVTIATNTSGRGTDIVLSKSALEAKGLHVQVSFYPDNDRIWNQNIGRGGRQGQPGSARLIIHAEDQGVIELIEFYKRISLHFPHIDLENNLFESLEQIRDLKLQMESEQRQMISQIEIVNYKIMSQFFEKLQQWHLHINDDYLSAAADQLPIIKLTNIKTFSNSGDQSDYLPTLCANLEALVKNNSVKDDYLKWLHLFKHYTTSEMIIQRWSQFFSEISDLENLERDISSIPEYENHLNQKFQAFLKNKLDLFSNPIQFFHSLLNEKFGINLQMIKSEQHKIQDLSRLTSQWKPARRRSIFDRLTSSSKSEDSNQSATIRNKNLQGKGEKKLPIKPSFGESNRNRRLSFWEQPDEKTVDLSEFENKITNRQ